MPTVTRPIPYIHLQRDGAGRIVEILHRREGDAMPEEGESDMGLFALAVGRASRELLPRYAREVALGSTTGERNFLPFIAWASAEHEVVTFPSIDAMEAVGVNTPEELQAVEAYLAARRVRPRRELRRCRSSSRPTTKSGSSGRCSSVSSRSISRRSALDKEIIVVDDGSRDRTVEIASGCRRAFACTGCPSMAAKGRRFARASASRPAIS